MRDMFFELRHDGLVRVVERPRGIHPGNMPARLWIAPGSPGHTLECRALASVFILISANRPRIKGGREGRS
jgi:hypothetical protein